MPPESIRVLVVDDEAAIVDTLACILRNVGFTVMTSYDGLAAISAAQTFRPDIVVSDFAMPNLNGIEASLQIKKLLPGCRIVILSGHSLREERAAVEGRGILFLQKPIHPAHLLSVLADEAAFPEVSAKATVLNVDDVEAHRYSLTRLFHRAGFHVLEAASGEEALQLAFQSPPDAVLLDIHLPGINGFEVCRALRLHPDTADKVIIHVTSSDVNSESQDRSHQSGADDYLPHPLPPKKLVRRTRELLQVRYLREG